MSVVTYARSSLKPSYSRDFARRIIERFEPADRLIVLSAWHQDRRVGILVLPHTRHTMYHWGGASTDEARAVSAHNLLHWEAILAAFRRGLAWYDWISTRGGPGKFKKTFGPVATPVSTRWEASSSRLVMALKNRYERLLRDRRRV